MFKCYMPKVEFGTGKLNNLGEYIKDLGSRAIVTIDPYLESKGFGERIVSQLRDANIRSIKYTDIQPNPNCTKVDEAARLAREEYCEMVVAIGGGSALDFGKGVAVIAKNTGKCWEYTERSDHDVKRPVQTLPVIAIPTTAGTGSEATPFAVFNNTEIKEKSTIVNDKIFPAIALVDPELMYSMPPRLTASTGFDAFAHALEAYISLKSMPFSKMVAREAMKLIVRYLPEAVANGDNKTARENIAWASTLAGAAIAHIGVTLPHSLGQPVGGLCGAPHGESIAACIVNILEISYISNLEVFAEVAEILDPSISNISVKRRAEKCPELVNQLLQDINLNVKFSDYGMTEKDIDKVTKIALTGYYFDINCHPKKVTEDEIRQIYKKCI